MIYSLKYPNTNRGFFQGGRRWTKMKNSYDYRQWFYAM